MTVMTADQDTYDDVVNGPMFPAINPGHEWLRAQNAGITTYTVYSEPDEDGGIDHIVGIFLDEAFARTVAAGRPISRDHRLCGNWVD